MPALLLALLVLLYAVAPAGAQSAAPAADVGAGAGGGAEPCPQGRISRIDVENGSVLAPTQSDPGLVRWGAGVANRLHVRTRRGFIRSTMLVAEGDCYDPFLITESQRLLEGFEFISRARVVAEDDSLGGKRVRVETRDEWTTRLDVGVTYDEGLNLENLNFVEDNFLGRGLVAHVERRRRRELHRSLVGLAAPNVFRRTNVAAYAGRTPDGTWAYQAISHPFVGRVGRFSWAERWTSTTSLFAYTTDGATAFSHVLAPVRENHTWLYGAARFGDPARLWVVGASLTRDVFRPEPIQVALGGDYDDRADAPATIPGAVGRQSVESAVTRAGLHVGTWRFRDAKYEGLDAVRDAATIGLGFYTGLSVAKSLPVLAPAGLAPAHDALGRLEANVTQALGPVLVAAGSSVEVRREGGAWRDLLADGNLVAYVRGAWLPGQTLFLRASGAGGWRTTMPYQLTLGGREGVRSLRDDAFPGGRQLLFIAEDRVRFGWIPANAIDLGATVFADWGRVWAGDVPYGADSGWRGAAGFGLRVAFPSGSRNVWRPDLVFPVGPGAGGSPIFRMTWELNRLRSGFATPDFARSRRYTIGPGGF